MHALFVDNFPTSGPSGSLNACYNLRVDLCGELDDMEKEYREMKLDCGHHSQEFLYARNRLKIMQYSLGSLYVQLPLFIL